MNQKTTSFAKTVSRPIEATKKEANTQTAFNDARQRKQPAPSNQNRQPKKTPAQPKAEMHLTMGGSIGRQVKAQQHIAALNKTNSDEKAIKARQQALHAKMKTNSQHQASAQVKAKTKSLTEN